MTMHRHRAHARDGSLLKLSRANRWLLAGSIALTGLFTELAAQAFPGSASARSTARGSNARKAHAKPTAHHASPRRHHSSKSLTPPAQAPQASEPASEPSQPSEASQPAREPAPETTHQAAPQASAPAGEPAPAAPQASPEPQASSPAPEESSAPVVSGGS